MIDYFIAKTKQSKMNKGIKRASAGMQTTNGLHKSTITKSAEFVEGLLR